MLHLHTDSFTSTARVLMIFLTLASVEVLVFPDADIMCPFDGRDDASKLAASFILGVTAAANKGIGVVVTSMEQLQVNDLCWLSTCSAYAHAHACLLMLAH